MKTSRVVMLALAVLAAAAVAAGAQSAAPALGQPGSLVEVYGLIDTGLRFSTNADGAGDSYFAFSQGLFNGSRFGIRGTEDLGGVKAIYTLEGGVILPYGALDQQAQIFGRQAWVGLSSSDYGTLTFGRQYGTFSDAIGAGDVFGVGHGNMGNNGKATSNVNNLSGTDAVNSFFLSESGFRWDTSIKYAGSFSGVTVGAMAALGNMVVSYQENTMFAGSLGYSSKDVPISGAVGVQYEVDGGLKTHTVVGGGVKYALDAADGVYAFAFYSAFDQGFTNTTAASGNTNSEFKGPQAQARTDVIGGVGANYFVIPSSLNVILAYYLDYAQNVTASGDTGIRNSGLVALDYYFSKDFDVYLGAWASFFGAAFESSPNGGDFAAASGTPISGTFSGMIGARFRF